MNALTGTPSPWVQRFAGLIPAGGEVLDLACGHGRHTRYLDSLELRVTAVDVDVSGIADLAESSRVEVVAADLEQAAWPLAGRQFDGIVVVNYLHRPLFPLLLQALGDGGVLIYDTFARGNEIFGKPRNPAFLLEPGELLSEFAADLSVVAYEFGETTEPQRAVRQRLCAVKEAAGRPQ